MAKFIGWLIVASIIVYLFQTLWPYILAITIAIAAYTFYQYKKNPIAFKMRQEEAKKEAEAMKMRKLSEKNNIRSHAEEAEEFDYEAYIKKEGELRPITDRYFAKLERIENNWSILYNNRQYFGTLAEETERLCVESIDNFYRWRGIEQRYEHSVDMPPNIPAFRRLAMLYEKQGRIEEAIQVCKAAIIAGMDERPRLVRMIKKSGRSPYPEEVEMIHEKVR